MILRILPIALLTLIASQASAQQPALPLSLVSTSGTAEIRVVPDLVDVRFEVEIRHIDLAVARQQQSERTTKLLTALRAIGVQEQELQSSYIQISPYYTENREETEKVKFYSVSQSVSCTLRDVKKLPDLIAQAVAAGATRVDRANFRTSDFSKHRTEARSKAIRAAREKAVALAAELGVKVGKPHTITESISRDWDEGNVRFNSINTPVFERGSGGSDPSFAPGTIAISETINVSFVIE